MPSGTGEREAMSNNENVRIRVEPLTKGQTKPVPSPVRR
jgi:hypothetical protein